MVGVRSRSVPESCREVALAKVIEQRDESPVALPAGDVLDAGEVGSRRLPDEEPNGGKALAHRIRLLDRDGYALVDDLLVQDRRHNILRAPKRLEPLDARERLRENADDADVRVGLLGAPSEAGDRAARPDS